MDLELCAICLRIILKGLARVNPPDRGSYTLYPVNVMNVLKNYGARSISTLDGPLPMFAVTLVKGTKCCVIHVDEKE